MQTRDTEILELADDPAASTRGERDARDAARSGPKNDRDGRHGEVPLRHCKARKDSDRSEPLSDREMRRLQDMFGSECEKLRALAFRITRSEAGAEEAVQNASYAVFSTYTGESLATTPRLVLFALLRQAIRTKAIDWLRRSKLAATQATLAGGAEPESTTSGPLQAAVVRERLERVFEALRNEGLKSALILVALRLLDASRDEVAALFGISSTSATERASRLARRIQTQSE